jgi:CheY-like chemotaxis protein
MASTRKILIADSVQQRARELARSLRERGYAVTAVTDGSRALEVAVLRHPDLILFDETCPLVDVRTFIQILRTNPRTEDVPVIVVGASLDLDRRQGFREGFLRRPFSLEALLGRMEQLFRSSDTARDLKGDAREIEGTLKQIGLSDLLQILGMNRRSGRLYVSSGGKRGEIALIDGRVVDARSGGAEGEKALFRILAWREGTFAFVPGVAQVTRKIERPMEDALLEGMRQADEMGKLVASLPPRNSRLAIAPDAQLPKDQHPVTAEVMQLLAEPRPMHEVIEACTATDFETLRAIAALLEKGIAYVASPPLDAIPGGPVLGPAELHALRARILRGRPASRVAIGRLMLTGAEPRAMRRFVEALTELPGFSPVLPLPPDLFGTLGQLELPDGVQVNLHGAPADDFLRPLHRPFEGGVVAAVILDVSEPSVTAAASVAKRLRIPVLISGSSDIPSVLATLPAGAYAAPKAPTETLRAALALAARPER